MLNWVNTVRRHSTDTNSLFVPGTEGGTVTVTVPVETGIVLGAGGGTKTLPWHSRQAASHLCQLADVLNQLSFPPCPQCFSDLSELCCFRQPPRPKRITQEWNGPCLLGSLNSPAASCRPTHAGGQRQAEGDLNSQHGGADITVPSSTGLSLPT